MNRLRFCVALALSSLLLVTLGVSSLAQTARTRC